MSSALIKSFKWDLFGNIGHHILGFIISVILARSLGPEEYGLVAMALVLIFLFEAIINIGLNSAIIKMRDATVDQYHTVFIINCSVGILLVFVFYTFGSDLVRLLFDNERVGKITQILSFLFLAFSTQLIPEAILKRDLSFDHIAKVKLIAAFVAGLVAVTMIKKGFGIYSLIAQHYVFNFGKTFLSFYFSKYKPKFRIVKIANLWSFGRPIYLSHLLYVAFNQIDSIVVSRLYEAKTLGLFNRAKSLANIVVRYTSGSITNIIFPYVASQEDNRDKKEVLILMISIVNIVSFLIFSVLFINSKQLIVLLYTDTWVDAVPLFELILMSIVSYPAVVIGEGILKGLGYPKAILSLELSKKSGIVLALLFGFYFGLEEYLMGSVMVSLMTFFLVIFQLKKRLRVSIQSIFTSYLKTLAVSFSAIYATYVLKEILNYNENNIMSFVFGLIMVSLFYLVFQILMNKSEIMLAGRKLISTIK